MVAIGGLLSTLCGAIGVLFWALIASKNGQIQQATDAGKAQVIREQELTNKLLPAVEENTRTLGRLVELTTALMEELKRERDRASSRGRSG